VSTESRIIENPSHLVFRERIFQRFLFFIRVLLMLFINFSLYLVFSITLDSFSLPSSSYIITFWFGYAIITIIAANFGYFIGQRIAPNLLHPTIHSLWTPLGINKMNWLSQIKYMAMLLFLVYIPLDFLGYCIPGMLEYSAQSIVNTSTGEYLNWDLQIMIPIAAIVHLCVAFREEFYLRNFFLTTAEGRLEKGTRLIYASLFFGLAHFNYIFSEINKGNTAIFPIMWGLFATIIGLMAAFFFLQKRMLWSLIIAHWVNNIISAIALQQHRAGGPFIRISYALYFPLLIISVLILIVKYRSVSQTILNCWSSLKTYRDVNKVKESIFPPDNLSNEKKLVGKIIQNENLSIQVHQEPLFFYILIDVLIISLLWFSSLVLS
jgi:membrane protease YdiL (CAAX protease family)